MKKITKAIASLAVCASLSLVALFGGCSFTARDGADGKNGQDVSIYEIYEATNAARAEAGLSQLTFLEFIEEYLGYTSDETEQITSLQTTMNRSLLSSVSILTTFSTTTTVNNFYGNKTNTEKTTYAGSGVIIDADTENGNLTVVTNCHVVYSSSADGDGYCDDISLYLYGGEYNEANQIKAEIVGTAKNYDIAVLKVEGSDVVKNSAALVAEWYDGEEVYLGESVYAIGNPEGEAMSVTAGIVSKDSEYITIDISDTSVAEEYSYRVLRTDAAINGGNSGGGLFNKDGKLIGIVNAKSVSEDVDNMGYALPAATTKRVVQSILDRYDGVETHGVYRALIGVTSTVSYTSARYNTALNVTELFEQVVIQEVTPGSKFARYINVGDVFKHITVTSSSGTVKEDLDANRSHNISDAMLSVRGGDTVTLVISRGGEEMTFSATYTDNDLKFYD